ncbi:hypothetical protein K0651_05065 [Ornithinimicrobium sp. Arc0846-15]|nr:hypothetical protein [Ornithinimicrobium laminariae]
MSNDDNAFSRLRDADPGRGASADRAAIRAKLESSSASDNGADTLTFEPHGRKTANKTRAMLAVAASTALIAGGGGFLIGQAAHNSTPGNATPASQGGLQVVDPLTGGFDMPAEGIGESATYTSGPFGGDSVALTGGEDLPSEGGKAEAFTYETDGGSTEDSLTEAAEALGMEGELITTFGDTQFVGDGETLYTYFNGQSVSFGYNNDYITEYCEENIVEQAEYLEEYPEEADGWPVLDAEKCQDPGDAEVTDDEARAMSMELATAFGVEISASDLEIDRYGGVVNVFGEGQNAYSYYNVEINSLGIVNANVDIASEKVSLGEYALIAPNQIAERQNDPILGRVWIEPEAYMDDSFWEDIDWDDIPEPPEPVAGEPLPIIGATADIESYELSTGTMQMEMGKPYVVPIYDVTTVNGQHVYVLALADEAINLLE